MCKTVKYRLKHFRQESFIHGLSLYIYIIVSFKYEKLKMNKIVGNDKFV